SQPFEMELFYYLLRYKGIYLWERRICSLSTAHTGEDMQYLEKAVKETIRELRNGGFAFAGTSQPIPDAAGKIKRYYNLTYAQQRYYVLNQIADLERAVHLTMAMTIKGPLNINKLAAGIQILTNRHDIFRIGFEMVAGEIHLRIHDNVAFQLSHQKASGEQEHIDEWVKKFIHPFDLSTPPLIRIGVVEFPGDSFLLLFDSHHIISDGETANIIIQDLIQLHHGQSLPQVKKNYLDYLDWWDTYSTSPDFKIHEQYWIEKFPTPPPLLQLPLDYLRPNKRNFKGSMVTIPIEKNTAEALKNSVRMSPATLFMLLLASYSVLLYKISGQEDIFIGIPVSLRGENDLDSVAGYLTNNLVFRAHPQMGTPFNTFLNEVKKEWLNAYSHKIYPYELLVEKIEKQKDPGRNPLFDALFIYENVDERILKIDNLDCRLYNFDPDFATYDLSMEVSEAKQSLEIKLYFATQLFKIETIETWAAYFTRILDKILINDAIVIRDILEGLPTLKQTVPPTMLFEQKVDTAILKTNKRLPSNEIEKKLIEIWEEELNREGVGVDDNFFMLGGRSLDTIRTVSRINNRLSTKISLSAIFQYPTVVDLAAFIAGHIMPGNVNIPPAPLKPAYALSQAQIRYWAAAQNLSGSGILEMEGNEITADVLILEGTVQIDLLEKAIAKITERHDILRTVYDEKNGGPVQMIRDNLQIPLEYIDLTTFPITLRKEKLAEHLGKKNKQKFNLKTGPLLTFTLYKMADSLHYLFVNACHISFDGWSVTIIMEELAGFYNAGKAGQTGFSLPPVYRYVDYVEWQERLLKSGQLENQAGYWQEYLAQQIPVAQIPADSQYQIKAAENQDSKIFILKLSKELTQNLHAAASHYNTTLFITLLSILKTWLAIMTNQTTITTGTVFSARTFPGLEKIPGIMMNVLPLRVELSGNPDFQKIIDLTRQAFLQTQNNQDYPLSLVAHKMRKVIDMNRDIYNVIFIGQEPITENIHFDGLKITSCLLGELLAKPNSNDDDFIQCEYTPGIDLLIEMVEENNQIKFILRYNHHKFSTKGIKEYFNHFQFVIEQVITSPTLHLSQLKPFKTVELDDVF
ncbi:MAG: condensation domain-containing protein, partial [Acidobacteria bacterium]|nr:condensation domain-containing protein [Acidobacteriota bacterium]